MSRHESNREDLIREATALNPRAEWRIPGEPDLVLIGLKRDGSLSIYCGQDPVYQFNASGQLRRAYVGGYLFRTQGTTLARLHRERTDAETVLVRSDLSAAEVAVFIEVMDQRLERLAQSLTDQSAEQTRSVAEAELPDFVVLIRQSLVASPRLAAAIVGRARNP